MQRVILTLVTYFAFCVSLVAQVKYTDVIQQTTPGSGKLTLHQSQEITDLVNGTTSAKSLATASSAVKSKASSTVAKVSSSQVVDSLSLDSVPAASVGKKYTSSGYRIQVYSGDNSRRGKNEAHSIGLRVKGYFNSLPVYINFISPHWVCRVGDFRTYEEASEYFRQMKSMGGFAEAVIVRSKITVRY